MSSSSSSSSNESSEEEIQFQERISLGHMEVEFSGVGRGVEERFSLLTARNLEQDFDSAYFFGRCTNWLALLIAIAIAVLLTIVAIHVPTTPFIFWVVLWWLSALFVLIGTIGTIYTGLNLRKGRFLDPCVSFLFVSLLIFVVFLALGSVPVFLKLIKIASTYVLAYDSESADGLELVRSCLLYAAGLCIPLFILLYITIRCIYLSASEKNTVIKYLMYWSLLVFILLAAAVFLLGKYSLAWDESSAVGGAISVDLLYGSMGISLVSVVLAFFYLFCIYKQWTKIFMLFAGVLFVLTLTSVALIGLEERAIKATRFNNNFGLNIVETCWEELGLVKYFKEPQETCFEAVDYEKSTRVGDNPIYSCFNARGGQYFTQVVYLSFDFHVVSTIFLSEFGFILLVLAFLLVSDSTRLRSSKKKGAADKAFIFFLLFCFAFFIAVSIWFPVSVCNETVGVGNSSIDAFEVSSNQGIIPFDKSPLQMSLIDPLNPLSNRPSYSLISLYASDGSVSSKYPILTEDNTGYRVALLGSNMGLSLSDSSLNFCSNDTRGVFFSDYNSIYDAYICFYGQSSEVFKALWLNLRLELNLVNSSFILEARIEEVQFSELNRDGLTSEEEETKKSIELEENGTRLLQGRGTEISETQGIDGSGLYYFSLDNFVPSYYYQKISGVIYGYSEGSFERIPGAEVKAVSQLTSANETIQIWSTSTNSFGEFELITPMMVHYGYPTSLFVSSSRMQSFTRETYIGNPYALLTSGTQGLLGDVVLFLEDSQQNCTTSEVTLELFRATRGVTLDELILFEVMFDSSVLFINSFEQRASFQAPCHGSYEITPWTTNYWLPSLVSFSVIEPEVSLCLSTAQSKGQFYGMITMDWEGASIDYDFEIILFDFETKTAQYVNPNQKEASGVSYAVDKTLGSICSETILIEYLVNSYYLVRVRPATAYDSDGVSWDPSTEERGMEQITLRVFQRGQANEIYLQKEPEGLSGELEWAFGCFHGGGWEYLRVVNEVGERESYSPSDCQSLYNSLDDLDAWTSGSAWVGMVSTDEIEEENWGSGESTSGESGYSDGEAEGSGESSEDLHRSSDNGYNSSETSEEAEGSSEGSVASSKGKMSSESSENGSLSSELSSEMTTTPNLESSSSDSVVYSDSTPQSGSATYSDSAPQSEFGGQSDSVATYSDSTTDVDSVVTYSDSGAQSQSVAYSDLTSDSDSVIVYSDSAAQSGLVVAYSDSAAQSESAPNSESVAYSDSTTNSVSAANSDSTGDVASPTYSDSAAQSGSVVNSDSTGDVASATYSDSTTNSVSVVSSDLTGDVASATYSDSTTNSVSVVSSDLTGDVASATYSDSTTNSDSTFSSSEKSSEVSQGSSEALSYSDELVIVSL